MNWKWEKPIENWQHANPVLHQIWHVKNHGFVWNEEEARQVLTSKGHQLKTWGGAQSTQEPHWIGVTKSTPLHTDPRYARYTWHLILKVDNFGLRGINKEEVKLEDNMLILLDTHSPHQLFAYDKSATYYFAASIDSQTIMPLEIARSKLVHYVRTNRINNDASRVTQ